MGANSTPNAKTSATLTFAGTVRPLNTGNAANNPPIRK